MIEKMIEKLFGKIFDDLGNKFFNFYKNFTNRTSLYEQLIKLPYVRYGEGRCYYGKCYSLKSRKKLLEKNDYKNFYKKLNFLNRIKLIKKFIDNFEITCWDDSDRFIISLIVLFDSVSKKDINKICAKHKNNEQVNRGLYSFFQEIFLIRPKLIDKKLRKYIDNHSNL